MELRQMQYFVALYEEGAVTRAARRLNVVQPAISMQIAKLEEEFGQALFVRTPKGMVPTHAGEEAFRRFVPILREIVEARQQLATLRGEIAGHISVGVIASVGNNALSECLAGFHKKYPKVTVRATGGYTVDLLEMVRRGELDIAVVNRNDRLRFLPTIEILKEKLFLIAGKDTLAPLAAPLALSEVARMNLVIPSRRHGLRAILDDAAAKAGVELAPRMEFDELKTIEDFVAMTDFVTLLPPIAIHRALSRGTLRRHAIEPAISRTIACAYSAQRPRSQATDLLIGEFQDRMQRTLDLLTDAATAPHD